MSEIRDAIDSLSGQDLIDFLANHQYDLPQSKSQPGADRYLDLAEPDPGYTPNSWSEVQHYMNTGVLDFPTYIESYGGYLDNIRVGTGWHTGQIDASE
ncbi:MAG: hypothetical protein NVS3B1_19660 [Marmoricola sp.]